MIESFNAFGDGGPIEMNGHIYHMHQVLLGGDQLTVACALGSAGIHVDHITHVCSKRDHLEGFYLSLKTGMLSSVY